MENVGISVPVVPERTLGIGYAYIQSLIIWAHD